MIFPIVFSYFKTRMRLFGRLLAKRPASRSAGSKPKDCLDIFILMMRFLFDEAQKNSIFIVQSRINRLNFCRIGHL